MSEQLYLESSIRDQLGLSDSLIKKTRREVVEDLEGNPCRVVVIQGRNHTAYPESVVEMLVHRLCGKKTRAAGVEHETGAETVDMSSLLSSSLVQGDLAEIQDTEKLRSTEKTLTVSLITKNRLVMLCENPDDADLPDVRLRVKDTTRFVHGMEIPGCRFLDVGLYEYAGRLPRARGRW